MKQNNNCKEQKIGNSLTNNALEIERKSKVKPYWEKGKGKMTNYEFN